MPPPQLAPGRPQRRGLAPRQRSRSRRWARALLAGLAWACASGEISVPGNTLPLPAENGFYYWLDPARCLAPCVGTPSDLVRVTRDARLDPDGPYRVLAGVQPHLLQLFGAAALAGHDLAISSGYRSYAEQLETWLASTEIGRAARPGHSEHQIGAAVDLAIPSTAASAWLAEHAFEYGFSLSFPAGAEKLTGVRYEPWHFRFVGEAAAREIHERGWSNVEYLRAHPELAQSGDCNDCPSAQSYRACGELSASGSCSCSGDVVEFCVDGAAGAVDCSSTGATCSADAAGDSACR